ncbi:MAG: phosphotransferase family protein, partial [Myxococcota bacterium]
MSDVSHIPQLTDVREAHRFDEAALSRYLSGALPGFSGGLRVMQFEGGQSNPTYLLESGEERYVLRKKPPGVLLRSAHQVDREFRVIRALEGTGVPVPRAHLLCEDDSVIGTSFFVMEHVEGRVIADTRLPGFRPEERTALYENAVETLAAIHSLDPMALGLEGFGRAGNYYSRQISRWSKQYEASKTDRIASMESLMEWLPVHVPESDETRVVHGD